MVQIKVKKPTAILFDISGTAARESFVEKILLPYFKIASKTYMENNWGKPEMETDARALSIAAGKDSEAPKVDREAPKAQQIEQLNAYVQYCIEKGKDNKALAVFRFHVWFDGYDRGEFHNHCRLLAHRNLMPGKVQTPVYSDVAIQIQKWHSAQGIRLYVLSNGWSEATKKFMSRTSHGDLNLLLAGHFDTSLGSLTNAETYRKVASKVGDPPGEICFLTKSPEEGKAAKEAGLNVVLVLTHRRNVEAATELCKDIPIARTFTEVEFI